MSGRGEVRDKPLIVAPPLFLKVSDLPFDIRDIELLKQAEIIAGKGRAKVAQRLGGIWRIHMIDAEARNKVFGVGMTVRGKAIPTYDINPNFFRDKEGNVVETTKLTIENIPISIGHEDVLDHLKRLNVEPTTGFFWINCREADNSLKRDWFNGNRFIHIKKPSTPLPEFMFIGKFKAYLNHQEQVTERACTNCLEMGHRTRKCKNPTVCRDCGEKGHRSGDLRCKNPNVCRDCGEKGHRSGDSRCTKEAVDSNKVQTNNFGSRQNEREEGEISDDAVCRDCGEMGHRSGDPRCTKEAVDSNSSSRNEREEGEISDDALSLSNVSMDEDNDFVESVRTDKVVVNLDRLHDIIKDVGIPQVKFDSETNAYVKDSNNTAQCNIDQEEIINNENVSSSNTYTVQEDVSVTDKRDAEAVSKNNEEDSKKDENFSNKENIVLNTIDVENTSEVSKDSEEGVSVSVKSYAEAVVKNNEEESKKDEKLSNDEINIQKNAISVDVLTPDNNEEAIGRNMMDFIKEIIEKKDEMTKKSNMVESSESAKVNTLASRTIGVTLVRDKGKVSDEKGEDDIINSQSLKDNVRLIQNMTSDDLKAMSEEQLKQIFDAITIETKTIKSTNVKAKKAKNVKPNTANIKNKLNDKTATNKKNVTGTSTSSSNPGTPIEKPNRKTGRQPKKPPVNGPMDSFIKDRESHSSQRRKRIIDSPDDNRKTKDQRLT